MNLRFVVPAACLAALAMPPTARSQQPLDDPIPAPIPQSDIRISLKPLATGLIAPIFLSVEGKDHDRKYIVDQTGLILVLKNGQIQPTPFLDVTGLVAQLSPAFPGAPQGVNPGYDERGLLGLAFHPDFHKKGRPGYRKVYTMQNVPVTRAADFPEPPFPNFSVVPNCQEVIAEWTAVVQDDDGDDDDDDDDDHGHGHGHGRRDDRGRGRNHGPDRIDPGSYRELLRFDKPQFNHNGGTIAFGPDGNLYASIGDGGQANDVGNGHNPMTGNAQDLSTILGKIIRINPLHPRLTRHRDGAVSANGQYRIPLDNPFFWTAGSVKEIHAYGVRNPYRMSFDWPTGRLIVADVGQNHIEEVDIVRRGDNLGWHLKEGSFLFDPQTGNVFDDPNPDPRLVNPAVEYDHKDVVNGDNFLAVVGGFVYRGSKIRELRGKYICADLTGTIFVTDLYSGRIERLMHAGIFVKGFGEDDRHEIYVLGSTVLGPSGSGGTVLAIQPFEE